MKVRIYDPRDMTPVENGIIGKLLKRDVNYGTMCKVRLNKSRRVMYFYKENIREISELEVRIDEIV